MPTKPSALLSKLNRNASITPLHRCPEPTPAQPVADALRNSPALPTDSAIEPESLG